MCHLALINLFQLMSGALKGGSAMSTAQFTSVSFDVSAQALLSSVVSVQDFICTIQWHGA